MSARYTSPDLSRQLAEAGLDLVREITEAVRSSDRAFEKAGGSSRHWTRDWLLPNLEAAGLVVVRIVDRDAAIARAEAAEARVRELEGQNQRLREENCWIPVKERLPDKLDGVILAFVYQGNRNVTGDAYVNHGSWWSFGIEITDPIAWRPMPEPPEVKE